MGKHRKHTNLQPTDDLLLSFLSTLKYSEILYGREYVSTPLYVFVTASAQYFRKHRAVHGLSDVGIETGLVIKNCEVLVPKAAGVDDFSPDFAAVRREAIHLTEAMGEHYLDIGHLMLASMRQTPIFSGVDKSMIRQYKALYCKQIKPSLQVGVEIPLPPMDDVMQSEDELPALWLEPTLPIPPTRPIIETLADVLDKSDQLLQTLRSEAGRLHKLLGLPWRSSFFE